MRDRQEEIEKRRQRARAESFAISPLPAALGQKFCVRGESGRDYRIFIDPAMTVRTCECHDFLSAGLGTCKHIEAVLIRQTPQPSSGLSTAPVEIPAGSDFQLTAPAADTTPETKPLGSPRHVVCFDVETQNSFDDVGGRQNFDKLRVSVAVLYDEMLEQYFVYNESEAGQLIEHLFAADLVVGYNSLGFDYAVIQPYSKRDVKKLPTLDLMQELVKKLGFRVKLDSVVNATLGARKSGHGLQAIEWFRAGEMEKLTKYCQEDVRLTYELFRFGATHGYVFIESRGSRQKVLVDWK